MKPLVLTFLLSAASLAAEPFWAARPVAGDPLFFIRAGDGVARAALLYVPEKAPELRSASLEVVYEIGRDFTWVPGSRELVLTADSRVRSKTIAELHPAPGAPNSYDGARDGKSHLLYAQGHFFHDLQSVASYGSAEPWPGPVPAPAPADQLQHLRARLAARGEVRLVVLGDSISTGLNASATGGVAPRQPGYPELVVEGLARTGAKIALKNLSRGGMSASWGLDQMAAVIAEAPDVLILAFGMNDASARVTPEAYAELIAKAIARLRAARPECDVILISPMTANPEWTKSAPDLYPAYAAALAKLTGPGCALADVTALWLALQERKGVLDLSGNGLNHPNDFGHRVYADTVLATIGTAVTE